MSTDDPNSWLWTNYSPRYSTKNNCSSHCPAADQEPSAHHPLRSLWREGHCTPSRLQSYIGDSAVLPWPQGAPDPTTATTLRIKTDKLQLEKGKGFTPLLLTQSHCVWYEVPWSYFHCYCPGKTSSLIWAASTPNWFACLQSIPTLHEPSVSHISPRLNSTPKYGLNKDYFLSFIWFFSNWGSTCPLTDLPQISAGMSPPLGSIPRPPYICAGLLSQHTIPVHHTAMYHLVHRGCLYLPLSYEL